MKKWIITGAVVFLCGLIVFSCAMLNMNWDYDKLSTLSEYHTVTKEYEGNKNIILKDRNVPVRIEKSADNKIHLTYSENEDETYSVSEQGNDISITKNVDFEWFERIFVVNFETPEFVIALPEKYLGDLDIKTSNANIELISVTANDCILKSSNGKIDLLDIFTETLSAVTSNSPIKALNVAVRKDAVLDTSNSQIVAESVTAQKLTVKTSNGDITAESVSALDGVSLKTSNADIEVDEIYSNNIILKTSNSDIEGYIPGPITDYTITSKTSNGDNNLPENQVGGSKTLDVKTSNGDIEIVTYRANLSE